jgi:SAM-dependent methyltransferase
MTSDSEREQQRKRIDALGYDYASRPATTRTSCNLCGGERFVTLTQRDRYGFPAQADGCLRCGLVFLNPAMTTEAYAEFYREIYRPLVSAYHGRLIDAETIQDEQREYAAERAELLAPHLAGREVRTLLDVGGSTGIVARHLKERFGLAATVIDPAPLEIDVARSLGLETLTGFVEDLDPGTERYDLITLCQTVDHLLDVALALQKIRALISEGGLFFIDIVDFRAAYRRAASVEAAVKIDHPFSLTEQTMPAYLKRSGFEILAVEHAADRLHVGYVCQPAAPAADALPSEDAVGRQWREIRSIQDRSLDG